MATNALSLAFIERRPTAAARVLNALPAEEAAQFLQNIPSRLAARALGRSSAWSASTWLVAMVPSSAAAILRALPYLDAVAILRLLRAGARESLLAELPRRLRRDLERSMAYPANTVGGRMLADIVVLKEGQTVADAIDAVTKAVGHAVDTVFLVDDQRRYLASIAVQELFRHAATSPLGELPASKARPLLARQSLQSTLDAEVWGSQLTLPVLGRRRHLVGALPLGQVLAGRGETRVAQRAMSTLADA